MRLRFVTRLNQLCGNAVQLFPARNLEDVSGIFHHFAEGLLAAGVVRRQADDVELCAEEQTKRQQLKSGIETTAENSCYILQPIQFG